MGLLAQVAIIVMCILLVNRLLAAEEGTFFLKASKSVPRIGRSNPNKNENKNTNDENFEKFFLKASKSVPRIGRRGGNPGVFDSLSPSEIDSKFGDNALKYPSSWSSSDIADLYEYNPELFSLPQLIQRNVEDSEMQGDDPRTYDWENIKFKRFYPQTFAQHFVKDHEILEPRFQPEMK